MSIYVHLAEEALWLILAISLPPLLASLIVSLIVSFVQALTQVQDQSLTFVPKILATVLTLLLFSSWMLMRMMIFAKRAFELIPTS